MFIITDNVYNLISKISITNSSWRQNCSYDSKTLGVFKASQA